MKFLKGWLPAFLWAGFIFYLSSLTSVGLPLFPQADKVIHIGLYSVLGFFVARGLFCVYGVRAGRLILLAALVALAYGMSDEVHQLYVPTRSAEIGDLISDAVGGFIGSIIYAVKIPKKSD